MTTNISLLDKEKCTVAILETVLPVQEMFVDSFVELGFKCLFPFSDLEDFIKQVQVESYDWCIFNLEHLDNINMPEFINNLYKVSINKSILVSVIHKKFEDENLLLSLFEQGCFSNFDKPYSMEIFEDKIIHVLNLVELYKGNYTFVAAEFIRTLLKKKNLNKSLLQFEKSLLDIFPGSSRCLLNLAEAQCLNNNYELANKTIAQAEFIDPTIQKLTAELVENYFVKNQIEIPKKNINIIGIQNCVIIDPDTDVQYYVSETIQKLGVTECKILSDGDEAIQYFTKNPEPNLIIMEWKLPNINGVALVQRIRKLSFNQCFIIIISSLVKESEFPLLQEVGIDSVIEKPFDGTKLSKELIRIAQRARKPLEQGPLERKIRILLASHQINEASELLKEYLNRQLISKDSKLQMQAEFEYEIRNYESACNNALNALKISKGSVLLFSLLGKCFLQLKDYKNATSCFERAHKLSPPNVDRILTLVDLKQEAGNEAEAAALLDTAKNVDSTRTDVVEMETRMAIQNADIQKATKLLKTLDSLTGVVGMINNDAVAKIRGNNFEEGVKLYKQALECLPIESNETREFITYNLGLAYVRNNELEKALEILNSIKIELKTKIYPKFDSLRTRVKYALMHGTPLVLKEPVKQIKPKRNTAYSEQYGNAFENIEQELEFKKGTRSCYKIFNRMEESEI